MKPKLAPETVPIQLRLTEDLIAFMDEAKQELETTRGGVMRFALKQMRRAKEAGLPFLPPSAPPAPPAPDLAKAS